MSTHGREQAIAAAVGGADYVGIGAMYPTETKERAEVIGPSVLAGLAGTIDIPIFPIGGIDEGNVAALIAAGVRRAAVGSAITASEDPATSAAALRRVLAGASPRDAEP